MPDDKDRLISSEIVEYKSMDLSEPMEVDEKDDVDSKCSESRTDEVTACGTLASGDKDMVDSSENIENGSKEADHSETEATSKADTVGKPESCNRTEATSEAMGTDGKLESRTPKAIDLEPPLACDLHVDSGKSLESRTELAGDIRPMAVDDKASDEIAAESESRIGEENDVEASNSTKISEEKASKGRNSDSLEVSKNVTEEETRDAKQRVDDCSITGVAAVELKITYDEKPESVVNEITGNGTAECTTDRNRDIATDGAEKLERSTSKLNYSEPNGGVNTDCTSLSKCLTSKPGGSEPVVAHDKFTNNMKPCRDKDHGESTDKPERVIKLVTYSKRKSSDKKHMVDSSEDPQQQKINEAVDSKTKGALVKHSVPSDMDS